MLHSSEADTRRTIYPASPHTSITILSRARAPSFRGHILPRVQAHARFQTIVVPEYRIGLHHEPWFVRATLQVALAQAVAPVAFVHAPVRQVHAANYFPESTARGTLTTAIMLYRDALSNDPC